LLAVARDRAATRRYDISFLEGAAEALPVPDASVDALLSVFGVIFASDPHRAAAELIRVTANSGRIVLTAWLPGGALSRVADVSRSAVFRELGKEPTPGFAWHDREALIDLFGPSGFSVEFEEAALVHRAASVDEYMREVVDVHPLAVAGRALLEPSGGAERIRQETRRILAEANEDPGRFAVSSRYAIVIARRSGGTFRRRPTEGSSE